jgi:hypothetical protein
MEHIENTEDIVKTYNGDNGYNDNNGNNDNNGDNDELDMFEGQDFVFTKKDGAFIGGGYTINSFLLKEGISPMTTLNNENQKGGKVSSPFENLAVPAGLFYINTRVPKKNHDNKYEEHYQAHTALPEDMVDRLYSLVEFDKKRKRKTKKHNSKQHKNKTRKIN